MKYLNVIMLPTQFITYMRTQALSAIYMYKEKKTRFALKHKKRRNAGSYFFAIAYIATLGLKIKRK